VLHEIGPEFTFVQGAAQLPTSGYRRTTWPSAMRYSIEGHSGHTTGNFTVT